jgi:outer membrane receptor for ferrienterochelin and colicins
MHPTKEERMDRNRTGRGRVLCGVIVASLALAGPRAGAQVESPEMADASGAAADEQELAFLLQILEEETEVATRSRMNSDYVPGIVTVLQGEELEALGVETVWEALSLVPGLQVVRSQTGAPSLTVRGLHFPFNSGNAKILVDSLPLNREDAGYNGIALDLPIDLVERVEVIRGPGSVVHGDFAFMGLVNIVTRKDDARAFLRASTDRTYTAGGTVSLGRADGWHAAFSVAGGLSDEGLAAEPVVANDDRLWAIADVRGGGFWLQGALARRDLDPWNLGPSSGDPQSGGSSSGGRAPEGPSSGSSSGRFPGEEQRHGTVQARYERDLTPSTSVSVRAGFRRNEIEGGTDLLGDLFEAGAALQGEVGSRHSWLLDLGYTHSEIDRATFRGPEASEGGLVFRDVTRRILSVTAQDAFDLSDTVTLTAGARLSDYDDLGSRLTPRFSLVWRVGGGHILKAQYAEGFRPPTFFELLGPRQSRIDFEVNTTTELNYVFRRPGSVFRATLFHSELSDMIYPRATEPGPQPGGPGAGPPPRLAFGNQAEGRATGLELEWERELGDRVKALANLSWVDADDDRNQERRLAPSPEAAPWVWSVAVSARPSADTFVTAHWNHVSDREAEVLPGYDVVDLTVTRNHVFARGLQLRLGVKNLFDAEVIYPRSEPLNLSGLRFGERTAWIQLGWRR